MRVVWYDYHDDTKVAKGCVATGKKLISFLSLLTVLIGAWMLTAVAGMTSSLSDTGGEDRTYAPEPVFVEMADGEYDIDVTLTGGTGRADVTSPCVLLVEDGRAYARVEWSSPYYDYMVIGGETYLPVNTDGNSVFEIPVTAFDEPLDVLADTTAMSVPHEIEYTLTFDEASIAGTEAVPQPQGHISRTVVIAIAACAVAGIFIVVRIRRKTRK